MKIWSFTIFLVLLLCFGIVVKAQRCGPSFNEFYVRDNQGNIIKDVKFEFTEPEKGLTDNMERFLFFREGSYTIFFAMDAPTPQGYKKVRISAEGFEPFEQEFYFREAQHKIFNLTLKRIGSGETARLDELAFLFIHIEDKEKKPVEGLKVILKSADGKIFEDKTSDSGNARFELLEGKYDLEIIGGDKFNSVKREKIEVLKKSEVLKVVLEESSKPSF